MSARGATPARARGPSWCWTGRGGGRPAWHGAGAGREADAAAGAAPPVPCVRNFGWFSPRAQTHTAHAHTTHMFACNLQAHPTQHSTRVHTQHSAQHTHAHIHACTTHNTNTYAHTHVCTHAQLGTAPVHPVPAPRSPRLLSAEATCAEQCGPKEQASTTLVGRGFPWGTCSVRVLARFWGRHGGGLNSAVARG